MATFGVSQLDRSVGVKLIAAQMHDALREAKLRQRVRQTSDGEIGERSQAHGEIRGLELGVGRGVSV